MTEDLTQSSLDAAIAAATREAMESGVPIRQEFTLTAPQVDAMLSGFRSVTGHPVYVPRTMYKAAKEAGLDMTNIEETKPIPLR
jgi:hypothetical protein